MAHKKNCVVCGKEYEYCPRCKQYASMEKWHNRFCDENCKELYDTINKFSFNHITANEASKKINDLKINVINDEINTIISEINANILFEEIKVEEKPKKSKKKIVEEEIVKEDLVEE